jgi:hypothetical protein
MSKTYAVSYEGWMLVQAASEDHAYEKANAILSKSNIINDGDEGEWELTGVSDEEEDY